MVMMYVVLSRCWRERNRYICGRNSQSARAASRHVFIAAARSVRCV
jgi:hypothetical protein